MNSLMLILSIIVLPSSEEYKLSKIPHYEGIPINESMEENIVMVSDYIEKTQQGGNNVYMAYEYAAIYMIPLDNYTKNWDLLLVGNLGTATIEELLDVEEDSVFLVPKDNVSLNKMAHVELINYIKENYEYIDEVQQFDVYTRGKK